MVQRPCSLPQLFPWGQMQNPPPLVPRVREPYRKETWLEGTGKTFTVSIPLQLWFFAKDTEICSWKVCQCIQDRKEIMSCVHRYIHS